MDNSQDFFKVNSQEINGMEWLVKYNDYPETKIFVDVYKSISIENFMYMNKSPPSFTFLTNTGGYSEVYQTDPSQDLIFNSNSVLNDSYVFLGTFRHGS